MSEGATPAGAGEGEGASGGQPNDGNPAGGDNNQPGAEGGEGKAGAEGADKGDDDLSDWSDPRAAKNRFTTLTDLKNQAEKAAREAEQMAAYWKGKADASAKGEPPAPKSSPTSDPNPEPDVNDKAKYPLGRDDPQFIEDRAVWRLRKEQADKAAADARDAAAKADFDERKGNYLRAVDAAKANDQTPNAAKQLGAMAPAITDLVAVSSHAALIAEHLHNNPDDYKALVKHVGEDGRLTPKGLAEVSRKLGTYEATLPGAFASKKASKAGTPAETVGGAGGGGKGSGNDPYKRTLTTEEYRAWRAAGGE